MPDITYETLQKMEERLIKRIDDLEDEIKKDLNENYVRKEAFEPIRSIVYGAVGLVLTGVVLALLALIIIQS